MKTQISKLQLTPGDIVVMTIGQSGKRKAESRNAVERAHRQLRKILPAGQRSIVMRAGCKLEKLADILTPEELHRLNDVMERRLMAAPAFGGPQQMRNEE